LETKREGGEGGNPKTQLFYAGKREYLLCLKKKKVARKGCFLLNFRDRGRGRGVPG